MDISKRVVISFLVAAIVLFTGMLFWPFILKDIIEPTAVAIWLLLRILVLSIDQKYFWYAVIFLAVFFLVRLLPKGQPTIQSDLRSGTNATIVNIGYWRVLFTYDGQDVREEKILKRELIHLLTSLYASKQSTLNSLDIYEALQQGEIPVPENIHAFLFPAESQESSGLINRFIQSVRKTLRKRIRQWTGQEKAEHFRMIEEVLHFLETSLEINNDNGKFTQTEHRTSL
jgi:hypothetical protein